MDTSMDAFRGLDMIHSHDKCFMFFTMEDILNKLVPNKIKEAQETISLDDDKIIAVMRYFNWNLEKAQEEWYDSIDRISCLTGIKFDQRSFNALPLAKKQEMSASLAKNNGGFCIVCYADFKNGRMDPEY